MHARRLLRSLLVLPAILPSLAFSAIHAAPSSSGVWTVTGAMHQRRAFEVTTLLANGQVLVAGGGAGYGPLAGAELYNPRTGTWTTTGSMHDQRIQFTATLLHDGRVLVAGGGERNAAGAELYNPRTGTWTVTGSMHEPRYNHTATLLPDGRVLVVGGVTGNCDNNGICTGITADADLYDPRTGTWTVTGSMHEARARQSATLLPDGQVLVVGGAGGGANTAGIDLLASAELYDPRTGAWTETGSLPNVISAQAATLLHSGLVLIDGGFGATGWTTDAELYRPRTGAWTITGSLHDPRGYQTGQTAALLANGEVLVAGGCANNQCSTILGSAELYNPRTGAWSLTSSLHTTRAWQPETLLANGQVLVAGGDGSPALDGSTAVTSVEIYHP